jgi:DNA-binding transcriptional MerR regulator
MTDQDGRFRINRVAESTGIPEATLRAWERRYQIPKPSRTPSGYRLYSPEDVAQVRKMRELCEAGVSPADAAKEIMLAHESAKPPKESRSRREPAPSKTSEGAASEARLMEVVAPEHANTAGVLSLSSAVDLMERAATVAAARGVRSAAIVVACGSVDLLVPVAAGQLIEAVARLVQAREGTIAVDVELTVENVQSGKREHVARSTFLLVPLEA